jgi:hypothetical protein
MYAGTQVECMLDNQLLQKKDLNNMHIASKEDETRSFQIQTIPHTL